MLFAVDCQFSIGEDEKNIKNTVNIVYKEENFSFLILQQHN